MAGRSRSMSQQATSGRTRTASQASAVEDGVFSAFASARRRATSNATAVESPPSNTLGATLAVDSGVAGEGGAAGAAGRRSRAASQATAVEATAPYSPRASEGGCDSRPASRGAGPAESSSRSRTSSIAPSIDGVSVGAAGGSALLMSMADSRRDSSASRTSGLGASGGLGGLGGGGGGGGVLVSGVAVGSLKSRDSMQSMPYSTVSEGDESNTQEDPRGERDSVYSADSNDEHKTSRKNIDRMMKISEEPEELNESRTEDEPLAAEDDAMAAEEDQILAAEDAAVDDEDFKRVQVDIGYAHRLSEFAIHRMPSKRSMRGSDARGAPSPAGPVTTLSTRDSYQRDAKRASIKSSKGSNTLLAISGVVGLNNLVDSLIAASKKTVRALSQNGPLNVKDLHSKTPIGSNNFFAVNGVDATRTPHYLDLILLTYRTFIEPNNLCTLIMQRVNKDIENGDTVLYICLHWVAFYWNDFMTDPTLQEMIIKCAEEICSESSSNLAGQLKEQILETIHSQQNTSTIGLAVSSNDVKCYGPTPGILEQIGAKELAEQLTLFDFDLFRKVHPTEYVYYFYPDAQSEDTDMAANLRRIIERFDEESYWVVAEICAAKNDKHRGVLIRKFIKTAHYCFLHNNFYSLFSILGALGFHQVMALDEAWKKVDRKAKKLKQRLELLMDPSHNMKAYREAFTNARTGTGNVGRIPFLPLHLKDLLFGKEGNADNDTKQTVNFDRLQLISRIVHDLCCSTTAYQYITMDTGLQAYLKVSIVDHSIPRDSINPSLFKNTTVSTSTQQRKALFSSLQTEMEEADKEMNNRKAKFRTLISDAARRRHRAKHQSLSSFESGDTTDGSMGGGDLQIAAKKFSITVSDDTASAVAAAVASSTTTTTTTAAETVGSASAASYNASLPASSSRKSLSSSTNISGSTSISTSMSVSTTGISIISSGSTSSSTSVVQCDDIGENSLLRLAGPPAPGLRPPPANGEDIAFEYASVSPCASRGSPRESCASLTPRASAADVSDLTAADQAVRQAERLARGSEGGSSPGQRFFLRINSKNMDESSTTDDADSVYRRQFLLSNVLSPLPVSPTASVSFSEGVFAMLTRCGSLELMSPKNETSLGGSGSFSNVSSGDDSSRLGISKPTRRRAHTDGSEKMIIQPLREDIMGLDGDDQPSEKTCSEDEDTDYESDGLEKLRLQHQQQQQQFQTSPQYQLRQKSKLAPAEQTIKRRSLEEAITRQSSRHQLLPPRHPSREQMSSSDFEQQKQGQIAEPTTSQPTADMLPLTSAATAAKATEGADDNGRDSPEPDVGDLINICVLNQPAQDTAKRRSRKGRHLSLPTSSEAISQSLETIIQNTDQQLYRKSYYCAVGGGGGVGSASGVGGTGSGNGGSSRTSMNGEDIEIVGLGVGGGSGSGTTSRSGSPMSMRTSIVGATSPLPELSRSPSPRPVLEPPRFPTAVPVSPTSPAVSSSLSKCVNSSALSAREFGSNSANSSCTGLAVDTLNLSNNSNGNSNNISCSSNVSNGTIDAVPRFSGRGPPGYDSVASSAHSSNRGSVSSIASGSVSSGISNSNSNGSRSSVTVVTQSAAARTSAPSSHSGSGTSLMEPPSERRGTVQHIVADTSTSSIDNNNNNNNTDAANSPIVARRATQEEVIESILRSPSMSRSRGASMEGGLRRPSLVVSAAEGSETSSAASQPALQQQQQSLPSSSLLTVAAAAAAAVSDDIPVPLEELATEPGAKSGRCSLARIGEIVLDKRVSEDLDELLGGADDVSGCEEGVVEEEEEEEEEEEGSSAVFALENEAVQDAVDVSDKDKDANKGESPAEKQPQSQANRTRSAPSPASGAAGGKGKTASGIARSVPVQRGKTSPSPALAKSPSPSPSPSSSATASTIASRNKAERAPSPRARTTSSSATLSSTTASSSSSTSSSSSASARRSPSPNPSSTSAKSGSGPSSSSSSSSSTSASKSRSTTPTNMRTTTTTSPSAGNDAKKGSRKSDGIKPSTDTTTDAAPPTSPTLATPPSPTSASISSEQQVSKAESVPSLGPVSRATGLNESSSSSLPLSSATSPSGSPKKGRDAVMHAVV